LDPDINWTPPVLLAATSAIASVEIIIPCCTSLRNSLEGVRIFGFSRAIKITISI
jgi:hypothetical protein